MFGVLSKQDKIKMYNDDDDKILMVGSENEETMDEGVGFGKEEEFGSSVVDEEGLLTADPYQTADEA